MDPQIRYAKTSDGVSLAYAMLGRGPEVLCVFSWIFNLESSLELPDTREYLSTLSAHRTIILFDRRGIGFSSGDVADVGLEAQVRDIETLRRKLDVARWALWADNDGAAVALAYAARFPQRVSRLVLWSAYACGDDIGGPQRFKGLGAMIKENWPLARRAMAGPDEHFAHRLRTMAPPEVTALYIESLTAFDIRPLLGQVEAPALVLQPAGNRTLPVRIGKGIAAAVPNARLAVVDRQPAFEAGLQFLLEEGMARAFSTTTHGTAVILFADIADSTGLTERLGDAAFRERARELEGALRAAIRDAGGTAIDGKLLGDGVLAVFTSARDAIEAAQRCAEAGKSGGLALHLGVHAGDVIREENNVYGGAVNIAARIADASAPGEVLVSQTVRDLARTSAGVSFEDRGERELKGVGEPVRVFAVRVRE